MIDSSEFSLSVYQGVQNLKKYNGSKEKVVIPDGIERIGNKAFSKCKNVKEVVIPGSVKCISACAFQNMADLEKVTFSEGLEIIEHEAFQGCKKLKKVNLPDSLKVMEYGAFDNCEKLEEFSLGKKLKTFEEVTYGCISMQSLTIPETIQKISDLNGMRGLKVLCVKSELKKSKKIYIIDCPELTEIIFPEGFDPARIQVVSCHKAKHVLIGNKAYDVIVKNRVGTLIVPDKKAGSDVPDKSTPVEFRFDEQMEMFVCEYKGLMFSVDHEPDEQACDKVRILAENYISHLNEIVKFMLPDLKEIYGNVTVKTAAGKLGKPVIEFLNGRVVYLEQTFDGDHIFEFEFMDDEFEDLDNFSIDG